MISSFNHPTHGPLTVHEKIGRSHRCQKENRPERDPAVSIVEAVRVTLEAMPDTVDRVRVAKEIWHLADRYLQS